MLPFGLIARHAVRKAARKAALLAASGLCLLAGAGFLLASLWSALAAAKGVVFASGMIGLALVVPGIILLAFSFARPRPPAAAADLTDPELLDRLQAAAKGGPGEVERALHGLLSEAGLPPPATGNAPAMTAAFVYGVTLAMTQRRRGRSRRFRRDRED